MVGRAGGAGHPSRQAIVDSAVRRFYELGYHGTSMRDIAGLAGITVGSIYHHFASKQEILHDIMTRVLTEVISTTRLAVLEAGAEPVAQLHNLMRAWALFHIARREEALVGITEIRSLEAEGRRVVIALRDEQEAVFRQVVDRGVAQGAFATVHPIAAVRAILSMGQSIAVWYRPDGESTPSQIADAYAELALGTVRAVGAAAGPAGRGEHEEVGA